MAIYLQISEGSKNLKLRLSTRAVFIGRSNKCHITLDDKMISGKHLAIKVNSDNHVVIKDLATTNGTYLNGNKIDEGLLYLDDFVQIGKVKIILLPTDMSSQELKIHQRDFERTNVTFVKLNTHISPSVVHDEDKSEQGLNQQQNLLAKIRKHKQQAETNLSVTRPQNMTEKDEVLQPNITFSKDNSSPRNSVENIAKFNEQPSSGPERDHPQDKNDQDNSNDEDFNEDEDNDENQNENEKDDYEFVEEDEYEDKKEDKNKETSGLVSRVKGLFGKR